MKFSARHLLWVNLALLALVAYGAASTVNTAIAAKLMPPPEVRLSAAPPPIEREAHRPATHYAAIHTRDIFNSAKPEPEKPKEPPKPTELRLKLWGVVVHRDGSSYCVIEDLGTRKQDLYRINDVVAGSAKVKKVEWDRVILDRDGRDEILELAQALGGPPGAPGAPGVPGAPGAPGVPGPVAAIRPGVAPAAVPPEQTARVTGVEQIGDGSYAIDRAEVDSALDNMNQLFTQIRAVPHFEGGQSTGFRLFAIRQNSIFDKIGLRNGDIIQEINGNTINDPSKALSMFNELRNQQELNVKILRNKEEKHLTYQIR
jgi:general secretion pathway protein C